MHAHQLVSGCLCGRRERRLWSPAGGGWLWRRMELLVRLARRRCGRLWRLCHKLQLLRLVRVHAHLHWRVRMRLELLLVWCMAVLDELRYRAGCYQRLTRGRGCRYVHLRCGHWSCKRSDNIISEQFQHGS